MRAISIKIGRLTNSIEDTQTREQFDTEITPLTQLDFKLINSKDWDFNWEKSFLEDPYKFYKLTIKNDNTIQGLMSFEIQEGFVLMQNIESVRFNVGRNKRYEGCPGNLIAFACKTSMDKGGGGYVSFVAKTKLVEHYKRTLGAEMLGSKGLGMVIKTVAAQKLIDQYFKS